MYDGLSMSDITLKENTMSDEEWNDLTKDQQGDWIEYWSNLEKEDEDATLS